MKTDFSLPKTVHVIGASGRSGKLLCRALQDQNVNVIAIVRNPDKWLKSGLKGTVIQADLTGDYQNLINALKGATHIVNTAHARHIPIILKAAPDNANFVFLGSTRKFTQWPDSHGKGVLMGEKAFLDSDRNGVILHPTMIYGAEGENNVQRLAALLRYLPIIPLPNGGKSLVQPIHQNDVTRSILSALSLSWKGSHSMVIAGASAITYRKFIELILQAAHMKKKCFIPLPVSSLRFAAYLTRLIPFLPTIQPDEIRRLTEDKNFNTDIMREKLRFDPIDFATGIKKINL